MIPFISNLFADYSFALKFVHLKSLFKTLNEQNFRSKFPRMFFNNLIPLLLLKNQRFFIWNHIWINTYDVSRILINSTERKHCIFFLANYYICVFQPDIIFE